MAITFPGGRLASRLKSSAAWQALASAVEIESASGVPKISSAAPPQATLNERIHAAAIFRVAAADAVSKARFRREPMQADRGMTASGSENIEPRTCHTDTATAVAS